MLGISHATIHSIHGEGDEIEENTMEENDRNFIENKGINNLIHDTFVGHG